MNIKRIIFLLIGSLLVATAARAEVILCSDVLTETPNHKSSNSSLILGMISDSARYQMLINEMKSGSALSKSMIYSAIQEGVFSEEDFFLTIKNNPSLLQYPEVLFTLVEINMIPGHSSMISSISEHFDRVDPETRDYMIHKIHKLLELTSDFGSNPTEQKLWRMQAVLRSLYILQAVPLNTKIGTWIGDSIEQIFMPHRSWSRNIDEKIFSALVENGFRKSMSDLGIMISDTKFNAMSRWMSDRAGTYLMPLTTPLEYVTFRLTGSPFFGPVGNPINLMKMTPQDYNDMYTLPFEKAKDAIYKRHRIVSWSQSSVEALRRITGILFLVSLYSIITDENAKTDFTSTTSFLFSTLRASTQKANSTDSENTIQIDSYIEYVKEIEGREPLPQEISNYKETLYKNLKKDGL